MDVKLPRDDRMFALQHFGAWELVPIHPSKFAFGCSRVYATKIHPNSTPHKLKILLVAKSNNHIRKFEYHATHNKNIFC